MVKKTEGGREYSASAYAYVPDPDKPSTWKLRMEDDTGKVTIQQLGRAAAAFSPGGFRGNRVQIPKEDIASVKRKLRAKYKELGAKDDEIPESLKESWDEERFLEQEKKGTVVQTIIFDKKEFSVKEAKAWAEKNDFTAAKVDEPANGEKIHLRQKDPADFDPNAFGKGQKFRVKTLTKGVIAVIGRLKESAMPEMPSMMMSGQSPMLEEPMLVSLRFSKEEFKDIEEVETWCDEHGLVVPKIAVPTLNMTMPLIDEWQDAYFLKVDSIDFDVECKRLTGQVAPGVFATVCIPPEMDMEEAINHYNSFHEAGARHTSSEMDMIDRMIEMLTRLRDGQQKKNGNGKKAKDMTRMDMTLGKDHEAVVVGQPLHESCFDVFFESSDPEGKEWEVCLIEAGQSKNKRIYSEEVLKKAIPLFEGVPANIFGRAANGKVIYDHLTNSEVSENPKGFVKNVIGFFKNVRMVGSKLMANLRILDSESWLQKKLKAAHDAGAKQLFGLSIDAGGDIDGRGNVSAIRQVNSVDCVTYPAAGGGFLRLVASVGDQEVREMTLQERLNQLLEMLAKAPADELKKLKESAPELFGQIKKVIGEDAKAIEEAEVTKCLANLKEFFNKADDKAAGVTTTSVTTISAEKSINDKLDAFERRMALKESSLALKEKLIDCKLPEVQKDAIRRRFEGRIFEAKELDTELAEQRKIYDALTPESARVSDSGPSKIEILKENRDKLGQMWDDFFLPPKGTRQMSFKECYILTTGDKDLLGFCPQSETGVVRISEAMATSSWPKILGDSVTRRLQNEYNDDIHHQYWRAVVSDIVPVADFRTNRRMIMGGFGTLSTVSESGAYQEATAITDVEATYSATKKGNIATITLEMVANDDVGSIKRIPRDMAKAAAETLLRAVFDILRTNATWTADSVAVFDSTHSNTATSALSYTTLGAARSAMRKQTSYQSARPLNLIPKYLVVPGELEATGWELVHSDTRPDTANRAMNIFYPDGIGLIVLGYFSDTNNWYCVADPRAVPTIEVGFYRGVEVPRVFVQDLENVGTLFTNDQITYKVQHIYGVGLLDYRGFYGGIVA